MSFSSAPFETKRFPISRAGYLPSNSWNAFSATNNYDVSVPPLILVACLCDITFLCDVTWPTSCDSFVFSARYSAPAGRSRGVGKMDQLAVADKRAGKARGAGRHNKRMIVATQAKRAATRNELIRMIGTETVGGKFGIVIEGNAMVFAGSFS